MRLRQAGQDGTRESADVKNAKRRGCYLPRRYFPSNYAACIIFFIRSCMSFGDTSSTCVAIPHRCPNGCALDHEVRCD